MMLSVVLIVETVCWRILRPHSITDRLSRLHQTHLSGLNQHYIPERSGLKQHYIPEFRVKAALLQLPEARVKAALYTRVQG